MKRRIIPTSGRNLGETPETRDAWAHRYFYEQREEVMSEHTETMVVDQRGKC